MAKVSLQNVSKVYANEGNGVEVTAVKGLSLDVADREFVVVIGPPGSGKSTLLRLVAGLENVSQGNIFIGERRVNDVGAKDRDVAMVVPNGALYPHLRVQDNLAFGLKMRKYPAREIKKRVGETAAILGIEGILDHRPGTLSGDQRQRVAIGRAIVRQPKVLLFDDPLSDLDPTQRGQMRLELTRLHQRLQTTMIYVTHDAAEAMTLGTRLAVMHDGAIVQVNAPLTVYHRPVNRFVAGFLGSPPMNFIPGRLSSAANQFVFKEDGGVLVCRFPEGERPAFGAFVGREVILGVRPEDLHPVPTEKRPVETSFQAVVDLIESLGSETHFHLQTGAHTVVCRSQAILDPSEVGHRRQFQIEVPKVHLFDPATTNRIG